MFAKLFRYFKACTSFGHCRHSPVCVTFTGGLGAQIISTAIYWLLLDEGIDVLADLTYFNQKTHINHGTVDSGLSIFPWQLDSFGISRLCFNSRSTSSIRSFKIRDGHLKIALFLKAMSSKSQIRSRFIEYLDLYRQQIDKDLLIAGEYVCVHLRRGDYVAVASHSVPIEFYIPTLKAIATSSLSLCVLSDSPLSEHEVEIFSQLEYKHIRIITEQCSPEDAFIIMASSSILLTSNSQFSLCAGLLSQGSVYIPTQWYKKLSYARNDPQQTQLIESALLRCCHFALWDDVPSDIAQSSVLELIERCQ